VQPLPGFGLGGLNAPPPAIGAEGVILVVLRPKLVALSQDGAIRWSYAPVPDCDLCPSSVAEVQPAVGLDGRIFIALSSKEALEALSPSGELIWQYGLGDGLAAVAPVIGPDQTVYVGTEHTLQAVTGDGRFKWSVPRQASTLRGPALGPDGTVYYELNGGLSAVRPSDGSLKWTFGSFSSHGVPNGVAVASDGTIYAGSDMYLYALNPDGSIRWQYQTPGGADSPVLGSDGTIFLRYRDLSLIAVR